MQVTRVAPARPVPSLMHRETGHGGSYHLRWAGCSQGKRRCCGGGGRPAGRGAGVWPDREHRDGAGPLAAQAGQRRHDPAVLLRGGTVRLCHSTSPVGPGTGMRCGCPLVDPEACRRPGQDRPARCCQFGQTPPGRRADGGVGSGCPARGDARSGAGAARCGAQAATGAPAALRIFAAPGLPLWPTGLDQAASPLVGGSQVRPGGASYRARRLHRGVETAAARRGRLTAQIEAMLPDWTLAPVVAALQTMRGMALVNAATLIAELGDLTRFANPRQLMAYLGLVPSEHSSGASVKRGGITKTGNGAARRLLIEAAWSYRFPARLSRELLLRQENQPRPIRDIAWKGQVRLCARYRRLARTGKPATVVTTAIARELTGFVWASARQVIAAG